MTLPGGDPKTLSLQTPVLEKKCEAMCLAASPSRENGALFQDPGVGPPSVRRDFGRTNGSNTELLASLSSLRGTHNR